MAVARQFNCIPKLQSKIAKFGGLQRLQNVLCSQVRQIMFHILKSGIDSYAEKDLFLEQIYVCGALHGFVDFYRWEYVKNIMSWQLQSGCFTSNHTTDGVIDLR